MITTKQQAQYNFKTSIKEISSSFFLSCLANMSRDVKNTNSII